MYLFMNVIFIILEGSVKVGLLDIVHLHKLEVVNDTIAINVSITNKLVNSLL